MTNLILPFLINYLLIQGIRAVFAEGMILERPGDWLINRIGSYWSKPIISCNVCMSSVWGSAFYLVYFGLDWYWPVWCIAMAGFIWTLNNFMR